MTAELGDDRIHIRPQNGHRVLVDQGIGIAVACAEVRKPRPLTRRDRVRIDEARVDRRRTKAPATLERVCERCDLHDLLDRDREVQVQNRRLFVDVEHETGALTDRDPLPLRVLVLRRNDDSEFVEDLHDPIECEQCLSGFGTQVMQACLILLLQATSKVQEAKTLRHIYKEFHWFCQA